MVHSAAHSTHCNIIEVCCKTKSNYHWSPTDRESWPALNLNSNDYRWWLTVKVFMTTRFGKVCNWWFPWGSFSNLCMETKQLHSPMWLLNPAHFSDHWLNCASEFNFNISITRKLLPLSFWHYLRVVHMSDVSYLALQARQLPIHLCKTCHCSWQGRWLGSGVSAA